MHYMPMHYNPNPNPNPISKYMWLINIIQYLNVFLHCNMDTLK